MQNLGKNCAAALLALASFGFSASTAAAQTVGKTQPAPADQTKSKTNPKTNPKTDDKAKTENSNSHNTQQSNPWRPSKSN
jgi:hypothetical protein